MENLFNNHGIINNNGILCVTPAETFDLTQEGARIIDIRERDFSDFKAFDVPGVIYYPLSEIKFQYVNLPSDGSFIVADSTGLKSKEIVAFLTEKGFNQVASMAGGFVEWERDNLPVKTDINERLTGSCACQLKPRERKKDN